MIIILIPLRCRVATPSRRAASDSHCDYSSLTGSNRTADQRKSSRSVVRTTPEWAHRLILTILLVFPHLLARRVKCGGSKPLWRIGKSVVSRTCLKKDVCKGLRPQLEFDQRTSLPFDWQPHELSPVVAAAVA